MRATTAPAYPEVNAADPFLANVQAQWRPRENMIMVFWDCDEEPRHFSFDGFCDLNQQKEVNGFS